MAEGRVGVVRLAPVPTTPRWFPPPLPLLIQGGEPCLVLMSPWIAKTSGIAIKMVDISS